MCKEKFIARQHDADRMKALCQRRACGACPECSV
jgi:hypothetical protein